MTLATRGATSARRSRRERLSVISSRLGPYARPHHRQLATALVASLVVVAAQLAFPWPLKAMVELTLTQGERSQGLADVVPAAGSPVAWLAGLFVMLGLVFGLAEHWQRLAVAKFIVPTINGARVGIFTRWVQTASPEASRRDPGDVLTRVVGDTARLRVGLKGTLIHLLQHGLFLVGVSVVLIALDARLGLVYLCGLSVALAIAVGGMSKTAAMARARRGRESRAVDQSIRAAMDPGVDAVDKDPDRERSVAVITQVKGLTAVAVQGVLALTASAVLILAVRFAEADQLNTSDVALVSSYLLMLHYPTMRMGRQITRLGPQITSAERLARLADPSHRRAFER